MGASLDKPTVKKQLDALQDETDKIVSEMKWDAVQTALDIAGIADPTPISDVAGAVLSAARGDWFGAAMSLVSVIPYAGDALGKTAKGVRMIAKLARLRKKLANNVTLGRQIVADALKRDAAAIRAKRALQKSEKIEDGIVQGCKVGGNKFGTQSPKNGWSKGADRGHGSWDPAKSGLDPDRVKKINSVTKGKPVKWKDGNPDFSDYTFKTKAADGTPVDATVTIKIGDSREADFQAAREVMAEKLGVKEFDDPPGYTWHHKEDGTTMELVPSALHNNVPHSGGVSVSKDPSY